MLIREAEGYRRKNYDSFHWEGGWERFLGQATLTQVLKDLKQLLLILLMRNTQKYTLRAIYSEKECGRTKLIKKKKKEPKQMCRDLGSKGSKLCQRKSQG